MKRRVLFIAALILLAATLLWAGGAEETEADDSQLRVILIIPGNLGDKSFFDSANRGLEMIAEELTAETKVIEAGTDSTKWEPALLDAVEGNWDMIISGSSMTELMNTIARENPNQKFINFDTSISDTPDNVYSMFYATNDIGFLAGTVGALVTNSGLPLTNEAKIIGFLGGMDIPGINDFLVGYIEGAVNIDPEIKILISYAGDFGDPAKGKELSLIQYKAGADISYNVAGGTGLGLLDAAKVVDAYAIGVDSDQAMLFSETDPVKAEHIVTSTVKRIDLALLRAVKLDIDGNLTYGVHDKLGIKEGGVGLAKNQYYDAILTDEIKAVISTIEQQFVDGTLTVSSAFGMSSDEVNAMRDAVSIQ
ncbi:MAG: BMP family ABC transporter substrate-binding protein [Bacteroidetes bacterium]|nr:BMP family ABC transporter substrate-binding protein [Bacteroidota bacterium]